MKNNHCVNRNYSNQLIAQRLYNEGQIAAGREGQPIASYLIV